MGNVIVLLVGWSIILMFPYILISSGINCWKGRARIYRNWPDAILAIVCNIVGTMSIVIIVSGIWDASIVAKIIGVIIILGIQYGLLCFHIKRTRELNPNVTGFSMIVLVLGRIFYATIIPLLAIGSLLTNNKENESIPEGTIDVVIRGAILFGIWKFTNKLMGK